jgi:hypothetical protein
LTIFYLWHTIIVYIIIKKVNNLLLDNTKLDEFNEQGFFVLPSFLPVSMINKLKSEANSWVDENLRNKSINYTKSNKKEPLPTLEIELGEHGWLITHPPLMSILKKLLGEVFSFHHIHSDRHDPGQGSKNWHHDYEQYPQSNRSHVMLHALHYLTGLDGTIGDLVVLPGSHKSICNKDSFDKFGDGKLPGELVIDNLPAGSTIVMHSALMHARREKKGGNGSRYFVDCSYCQGGIRWPVVKRHWKEILERSLQLGLDRKEFGYMFQKEHFFDPNQYNPKFEEINKGSLIEKLV